MLRVRVPSLSPFFLSFFIKNREQSLQKANPDSGKFHLPVRIFSFCMNFFCVAKKMGLLTSFRVAVAPLRLVGALRRRRVPSPCPAIASAAVDLAIFFCLFSRKRDRSSRDNGTARHLAAARLPRLPCASRPAVCDARAHFASLVSSPVSLSRHSFSDGG